MASFQAKIGWERPIMRKIKKDKKFKKIKKYHCGFNSSQNRLEIVEKERK